MIASARVGDMGDNVSNSTAVCVGFSRLGAMRCLWRCEWWSNSLFAINVVVDGFTFVAREVLMAMQLMVSQSFQLSVSLAMSLAMSCCRYRTRRRWQWRWFDYDIFAYIPQVNVNYVTIIWISKHIDDQSTLNKPLKHEKQQTTSTVSTSITKNINADTENLIITFIIHRDYFYRSSELGCNFKCGA